MSLEVFVRASGDVMGVARDSFGLYPGVGGMSAPATSPMLAAAVSGSGQAATAANTETNVVNGQVSTLGQQNLATNAHLNSALTAASAGRCQMDGVISSALADINCLAAAATASVHGQLALVNALAARLEQTWQALTNGNADASTRAASSAQLAAAYNGLGNLQTGGVAPTPYMGATSPASFTGGMSPMGAMAPMQMMPMMAAQSMAANQAALAQAQQVAQAQQMASIQQQPSAVNGNRRNGPLARTNNPKVNMVISRAMGQRGVPYSWGGGGTNGPTFGIGSGANTKGFDCSGLVRYAYWPFVHLPRTANVQMNVGVPIARAHVIPGDLIFSNFDSDGAGHVQMAIGYGPNSRVVEAEQTGTPIKVDAMASGHVVVKRLLRR
jgi:cell wall-associated NlpC family hydrolase